MTTQHPEPVISAGKPSLWERLRILGRTPVAKGAWLPALLVFVAVFVGHSGSCVRQFTDSRWAIHIAMSMIRDGNVDLDEYAPVRENDYALTRRDGHWRSVYPVGTSLLCVPLVFVMDKALLWLGDFDLQLHLRSLPPMSCWIVPHLQVVLASCLIAFASVFIYLMGRLSLDNARALLLAGLFAFCTSAWSTGSRALWQQGPSMLTMAAALYVLLLAARRPAAAPWIALPLLLACTIRPTNYVHAAILFLAGAVQSRRSLGRYLLVVGGVFAVTVVCWPGLFEAPIYGSPTTLHQQAVASRFRWDVLMIHIISPNRGLLVFTPMFLFIGYGIVCKVKTRSWSATDSFVLLAIVAHWLVISQAIQGTTGGHCFGPRLFSDITPFFIYFLIPAVADLSYAPRRPAVVLSAAFWMCIAASFTIHLLGAMSWSTWDWNSLPAEGNLRVRVWDWKDLQFLRGIRPSFSEKP